MSSSCSSARSRLVHHDLAGLHHVTMRGDGQRHRRVLLDQQDGRALLVDLDDEVADLLHQQRCQPQTRLVEQQVARLGHERAAHRDHLLLARRTGTRRVGCDDPADREQLVDPLQVGRERPAFGVRADPEVLLDGQLAEDPAALHHLRDAASHDPRGVVVVDRRLVQADRALRDLSVMHVEQTGDGAKQRRLPGTVGAQERHDRPVRYLQAHAHAAPA